MQICSFTARIKFITQHCIEHPKDHSSRRGLLKLVSKRRRMMLYYHSKNPEAAEALAKDLGIRFRFQNQIQTRAEKYREFTLRAGDLWYAPPNLIHAVLTLEPSIMMSANYFADPIRAPTQQREGLNKSRAHTARPHGRASTYANGKRRGTASGAGAKL